MRQETVDRSAATPAPHASLWFWLRGTFGRRPHAPAQSTVRTPVWFHSFFPNKIGNGSTITLPALFVTEVLGGTVADVGIVSSLTSAATVPAAAFWGWMSDRVGTRKLYLMLGFAGFALPTLLMGYSQSVAQYLLLSILVGALSVAGTPVSSTLIMDTTPREDWDETFGRFNQISGWGMVAGRFLGLVAVSVGLSTLGNERTQRGLWIVGGILSLLSVLWAWRTVPEPRMAKPRPPREPRPELARYTGFPLVERARFLPHSLYHLPTWNPVRLMRIAVEGAQGRLDGLPGHLLDRCMEGLRATRQPLIAYYLASFLLFTMITMGYTPFSVWQRQDLQNSTGAVFLVGMMNTIAAAFSYSWMGNLTRRYGSLRVQMITIALRAFVFVGLALMAWAGLHGNGSVVLLIILQSISGLGWAGIAVAGNSTVARLALVGNEGAVMGAYTSVISIGAIVGALISGYLVIWIGYASLFVVAALGIAASVLWLWLIRRSASHLSGANL